jgi:putative ATPase
VLIGATTENPSFEVNAALLSRAKVFALRALSSEEIQGMLQRALTDREHGLGALEIRASDELLEQIAIASNGDGRAAYNTIEAAVSASTDGVLSESAVEDAIQRKVLLYDKSGEEHYNLISALHKSVRSSDPDAALYWFARMLDGGCDPVYLARRLTRMAVEDVGLADPRALQMAIEAWDAYDRLGSPEGDLALAQVVLYLASTAKSNAAYMAFGSAQKDVRENGTADVPMHLRNAPTKLMKQLGYAKGYQYDPDVEGGIALDQTGFPDAMGERVYYEPVERGMESKLKEKLDTLRDARAKARKPC